MRGRRVLREHRCVVFVLLAKNHPFCAACTIGLSNCLCINKMMGILMAHLKCLSAVFGINKCMHWCSKRSAINIYIIDTMLTVYMCFREFILVVNHRELVCSRYVLNAHWQCHNHNRLRFTLREQNLNHSIQLRGLFSKHKGNSKTQIPT